VEAPGFDLGKWLKDHVPETPEGIAKVEDWKAQRTLLSKALEDLKAVSIENEMLKATGAKSAEAAKPGAPVMPESDAIKALQLELESVKTSTATELEEYRQHKARAELQDNHAFKAEFDGKRAAILDEMTGVVKDAELDEKLVNTLLEAGSEYKINKALEEVTDKTAKSLLASKAKSFLEISKAKDAALSKPIDEVKRWKDYHESLNGVMVTQVNERLRGGFVTAAAEVAAKLTSADGDIFFRTPGGAATLQQLTQRFQQGLDLTPAEVVEALAMRDGFQVYRGLSEKQAKTINELRALVQRYENQDPSKVVDPAAPKGGGKAGFDMSTMFGA
jgi:hypothetical protein